MRSATWGGYDAATRLAETDPTGDDLVQDGRRRAPVEPHPLRRSTSAL